MHHEICARSLLAQGGALAAGLGEGALKNLTAVTKSCQVKPLVRLRARETMRFWREEEHWEVGSSEGMGGTGIISAGECCGRARSLGEKGAAVFPV